MFEVTRLSKLLIMVRDVEEAYDAFSLDNEITVISPVHEGTGARYFTAVINNAGNETKKTGFDMIYDCSNSFKDAVEALRQGAKVIKVTDDYKAYFKVIDIANKYGAKVVTKLDKKPKTIKSIKKKDKKGKK